MRTLLRAIALCVVAAVAGGAIAAQQIRFDDAVRNLRHPDPKARIDAIRMLRQSRYPEAIGPMAALVNDPEDAVQIEAIGAELAFFLVDDIPAKKMVAGIVEVRNAQRAPVAFDRGPLAVLPRDVPADLVTALARAIDDDQAKVRLEALYALGTIARPSLAAPAADPLVKALDHYDPVIRAGAARVIGRLRIAAASPALIKAVNDSQPPVRFAAMRALGEIRETDAVQALTEQLQFYGKGEGAWSALDGLARIAHASSAPLFASRLADRDPMLRRAAAEGLGRSGDQSQIAALETAAASDGSETARVAFAFALQRLGKPSVPAIAEALGSPKVAGQAVDYLIELGPPVAGELTPFLQHASPAVRANAAGVLGFIGAESAAAALQPLLQDRDRDVVDAATHAIERLKMPRS